MIGRREMMKFVQCHQLCLLYGQAVCKEAGKLFGQCNNNIIIIVDPAHFVARKKL